MPRILISDDGVIRRYRVTDAGGTTIGYDDELIPTAEDTNAATLRSRAQQALTANAAFLAVGSPTNAQTLTQVQRLTRECSALIRLLLGQLDDTAGT